MQSCMRCFTNAKKFFRFPSFSSIRSISSSSSVSLLTPLNELHYYARINDRTFFLIRYCLLCGHPRVAFSLVDIHPDWLSQLSEVSSSSTDPAYSLIAMEQIRPHHLHHRRHRRRLPVDVVVVGTMGRVMIWNHS